MVLGAALGADDGLLEGLALPPLLQLRGLGRTQGHALSTAHRGGASFQSSLHQIFERLGIGLHAAEVPSKKELRQQWPLLLLLVLPEFLAQLLILLLRQSGACLGTVALLHQFFGREYGLIK